MAKRPIYIPSYEGPVLVATEYAEFIWHAGMAPSQKKKSVESLHQAAISQRLCEHPLEVSSKSSESLGVQLSAFNLTVTTKQQKRKFTVETAYQSSKCFEQGGPYTDLLHGTSLAAKKDPRLKESGCIVGFKFFGKEWPLEPKTAFYDWLYINALKKNPWAIEELRYFDAFTDIEFNPKKSINCQAYSVALFLALEKRGVLEEAIASKEAFLEFVSRGPTNNASENTQVQPRLL